MSIFSFIGHLFTSLFNSSKSAWEKLSPQIQSAMLHGSGILNIINQNYNAVPADVIATIQAAFPDLELISIHAGLQQVAKGLNVAEGLNSSDLPTLITGLQNYFKAQEGETWSAILSGAANLLSLALSPTGTPFEIIATLGQFVYSNFIKHKVVVMVSAPVPTTTPIDPATNVAPTT